MINGVCVNVEKYLREMGLDYDEDDKRYMICCPFHNDHSPSCGIWKDSGYFHCWGCHEEGSMADLLVEVEGITLFEARRRLRGEDDITDMEDRLRKMLHADDDTFRYLSKKSFHKVYPPVEPDSPEWEYLVGESRKLNAESIRRFDIREGVGSKYRDRVVIPIFTCGGKLLSYVARTIVDRNPKTRKARSPHRTLFGLFELLRDTNSKKVRSDMVVVEGEFDAIYLQQFGIPAVSNMGTSNMTPEKIRLLRKYARKIYLCYDSDEAGDRAIYGYEKKNGKWKEGQLNILKRHIPTEVIFLPDECDPNDLSVGEVRDVFGVYFGNG